jgi:hypothetical protein
MHNRQDIETEVLEQARLLGMSGEREASLLAKLESSKRNNLKLEEENKTLRSMYSSLLDLKEVLEGKIDSLTTINTTDETVDLKVGENLTSKNKTKVKSRINERAEKFWSKTKKVLIKDLEQKAKSGDKLSYLRIVGNDLVDICYICFSIQKGRYQEAISNLENVDPELRECFPKNILKDLETLKDIY